MAKEDQTNGEIEAAFAIPTNVTYTANGVVVERQIFATSAGAAQEAAHLIHDFTGAAYSEIKDVSQGSKSTRTYGMPGKNGWKAPWIPSGDLRRAERTNKPKDVKQN